MRAAVRFLLGHGPREIRDIDPTMTVLEWLRRVEHRMGTKEGCAEGDCGACTVVVAKPQGDGLELQAVNSCIRFVPTLDGCQLLTVEDLKAPDGTLHPVQQAMVESHGSQCGFCTPGFVMSLYKLYRDGGELSVDEIDDALAGNLCRCTGYGPIIQAAQAMRATPGSDAHLGAAAARTHAALTALRDEEIVALEHDGRRFFAPATLDQLADLLVEHPEATVLAGSTDVGLWVTKQFRELPVVVYIGRVEELRRIEQGADSIEIGAGVSYQDAMPVLAVEWPDMGELIRRLGSVQIRNMGTIGGNIANGSPIGDGPPALIAADATLVLRRGAERRRMPLEAFFLGYGKQDRQPGEFVEKVIVPRRDPAIRFRCYKISKRFDQDISAVMGAFAIRLEAGKVASARIAYGGMAATPRRATAAEQALVGRPWRRDVVEAAMLALGQDFTPLTDMRASADYRMRVARNLLLKCHVETAEPESATRLVGDRSLAHV
jgi:xanthine dehydrogenase small subunit